MSNLNFNLEGKVALITGASRGIGQAIAEAFAAAGAKVVLSSRKQESLEEVADEITAAGGSALPVAAHSGDEAAVQNLVKSTIQTFGGVDILVNNAATNIHFGPILTASESQWSKILDTNILGYFRVSRACVESMRERGGGKIINIASVAGIVPGPGMGIYSVSKAGVLMLTKVLAAELADDNIQVNAIAPGFIKTRFSRALWDNPTIHDVLVKSVPQNRMATADELTGTALYLASDASSYTTGATIVVDGGLLSTSHAEARKSMGL